MCDGVGRRVAAGASNSRWAENGQPSHFQSIVVFRGGGLRIPVQREQSFWPNVNTDYGST